MRRIGRVARGVVALLAVAIVGVVTWLIGWVLPIATGAAAKTVCSDVFVAGRDPAGLLDVEVPSAAFVDYEVDRAARRVTASALGLAEKTAVARPGLGCVLALEAAPEALQAEGFEPTPRPDATAGLPWPEGQAIQEGDPPGLDRPALTAAIDAIFTEDGDGPPLNTRAVVIIAGGRIVAERYAPGFTADTPQLGWSMTKSVTSALIGVLAGRGQLDIDAPIGFAAWQGDERRAITWDQLLRMSSGLAFEEEYSLRSDVTVMLFDLHDSSALPLAQGLAAPIDSVWYYSSGTTNLLSRRIREVVGDDKAYRRLAHDALFVPIGMHSAVMEADASGVLLGSSFMYATPRDWARFGLLYLRGGVWGERRILPAGWVERSITPTPTHPDAGYGLQWWLNAAKDPERRPYPGVPADAYFASGHQGQVILVVPSRDAVIVRFGMTNGRKWPRDAFATAVLAALPPGNPPPVREG